LFFYYDTATSVIYTLSLHDALPIYSQIDFALDHGINFIDTAEMYSVPAQEANYGATEKIIGSWIKKSGKRDDVVLATKIAGANRSEEHTSELQSLRHLVCRLLLEKK